MKFKVTKEELSKISWMDVAIHDHTYLEGTPVEEKKDCGCGECKPEIWRNVGTVPYCGKSHKEKPAKIEKIDVEGDLTIFEMRMLNKIDEIIDYINSNNQRN